MGEEPLDRVRELCLALPEATEEPAGQHASFRIRGKTFVWFTDDHHGDGRVAVTLKAPPGVQQELIAADPVRFFAPAYLHHRGWVGVRVDRDTGTDWEEVGELVRDSYRLVAPKRLGAQME